MVFTLSQIKRLLYLALYTMYERWQLVVWPLLIVPVAVLVIAINTEKQYVNHATILIEESALLNPYLGELEFSFELSERMAALRTLVLSRKNLRKVIEDVGLVKDLNDHKAVREMQKKLSESTSITLVGDELVKINFKWTNPEQMKPILSVLVEMFIERLLAPTQASLDTSELFFKEQLNSLRVELETAEDKLALFKKENRAALPELLNINQDTLARLEQEKQEKSVELSGAKAKYEMLKKQLKKANPVMGRLEESIVRLEADIALLRTRYTDKHSKIQAKLRQLETQIERKKELQAQAKPFEEGDIESLWQIANNLPLGSERSEGTLLVTYLITLEEAQNLVAQLENEIAMLKGQIEVVTQRLSSSSEIDKTLRQLQRDYQVKQDLYSDMLERYEMSKVTGQLVRYEGPDKIKTIERAYSPTVPINHSIVTSGIIGLVLGIFCAIAMTFVAVIVDLRVRDTQTIEVITGQRVLTKLPIVKTVSFNDQV